MPGLSARKRQLQHLLPVLIVKRILLILLLLLLFAGRVPAAAAQPDQLTPAVTMPGAVWKVYTLLYKGNVGQYASIALDPETGLPNIGYYDATNAAVGLVVFDPASGNCGPFSLWSCRGYSAPGYTYGQYASIAMRGHGEAYIATYATPNSENMLYYNRLDNSVTSLTPLDYTGTATGDIIGRYNSLKFDSQGNWNVAYYRAFPLPGQLRFGHQIAITGNCGPSQDGQCDVIDSGQGVGAYAALGLNGDDTPYIAYAGAGGALRLARKALPHQLSGGCSPDTNWICDTIDPNVNVGASISLYVPKCAGLGGCTDSIRIAYYDLTSKNVKYAHTVGSGGAGNCGPSNTWQCDVIDYAGYKNTNFSINNMGVSMAVANGIPTIAYVDATGSNTVLKVARPASMIGNCGPANLFYSWQCDTIDEGYRGNYADVGAYPALAVNSLGLATIAYYDATNGDLDFAQEQMQVFLPVIVR